MVQLLRREPVTEYELRDPSGRSIGQVIDPVCAPRTGPGAATVLLVRNRRRMTCAEISSAA